MGLSEQVTGDRLEEEIESQISQLKKREPETSNARERNSGMIDTLKSIKREVEHIRDEEELEELEQKVGDIRDRLEELKKKDFAEENELSEIEEKVYELEDQLDSRPDQEELEKMADDISDLKTLRQKVEGLSEDVEKTGEEQIEENSEKIKQLAKDVREQKDTDVEERIERLEKNQEELKEMYSDTMENLTQLSEMVLQLGKQS